METYAFGNFRLDGTAVSHRGAPIKLTAKSLAVLTILAIRAPEVVSRDEFEAAVWPDGFIEASNLTQTIYMIRTSLARVERVIVIETYNGQGYRLALPVVRDAQTPETRVVRAQSPLERIASPIALAFGVACASAFVATRETPPAPSLHHTVAQTNTGGTLPIRAVAATMH